MEIKYVLTGLCQCLVLVLPVLVLGKKMKLYGLILIGVV